MIPKVAVVGAGYFAQFHLSGWQRLANEGRIELVGVIETDPTRREHAERQYQPRAVHADLDECLQACAELTPDLVDIATPPQTHHALVQQTAAAGIDCIVQKPLAPTMAEAIQVVELAETAGTRLIVHENFRWMPWYREMKSMLDAGALGAPHGISVRLRPGDGQGPEAYLSRQPYFQKMPRFLVHETAIHFIDSFRFLLGEVTAVTARLRRLNPAIAGEDAGYIVLEFASGACAMIDGNRLNDHSAQNTRLTMGEHWLEGSAGVLHLNGDGALAFKPHGQAALAHPYNWNNRDFGGDCVYTLQKQIVADLASGIEPANTGRAYLRNIEIEEAVYRSHEERRTIEVQ